MQHGKDPPLIASLYRGRSGVGFIRRRVTGDPEYVHNAIPNYLTLSPKVSLTGTE
jgi:hypothetical protein